MNTYVTYLYHRGPFDDSEPEFTQVDSKDLNVHVPKDAVGFRFVEAKTPKDALKKMKDCVNYLLGSAEQVLTIAEMEKQAKINTGDVDSIFRELNLVSIQQMNEYLASINQPPAVAQFVLNEYDDQMGMFENDVVLDPVTRQIVYPIKPEVL